MKSNQDKSVSLKEIRDKLYELRDLEIQNLWQRASIFAGLIGLFFAGYGYIVLELIKNPNKEGAIPPIPGHVLCCGIAMLAIIFSVIWIAMAKGAKAWFEVQEHKICEIEDEEELAIPLRFRMGKICYPGSDKEPNDCLLSMEGGRYSVSKLNIFLGQVLLIFWSCIFIIHILIFFSEQYSCIKQVLCCFWYHLDIIAILIFISVTFLTINTLKKAKSKALQTKAQYLEIELELSKEEMNRQKRRSPKIVYSYSYETKDHYYYHLR